MAMDHDELVKAVSWLFPSHVRRARKSLGHLRKVVIKRILT
jgi:hypothetical protein